MENSNTPNTVKNNPDISKEKQMMAVEEYYSNSLDNTKSYDMQVKNTSTATNINNQINPISVNADNKSSTPVQMFNN